MTREEAANILGVTVSDDTSTITKAYRTLALKHHPDKNQGSKESEVMFKSIARAKQRLAQDDRPDNRAGSSAGAGPERPEHGEMDQLELFKMLFENGGVPGMPGYLFQMGGAGAARRGGARHPQQEDDESSEEEVDSDESDNSSSEDSDYVAGRAAGRATKVGAGKAGKADIDYSSDSDSGSASNSAESWEGSDSGSDDSDGPPP